MRPNDQARFLHLDRNVEDVTCYKQFNLSDVPTTPEKFFKAAYWSTFTKTDGLKGMINFDIDGTKHECFEFDIEYEKDSWYSLSDGVLYPDSTEKPLFPQLNKVIGKKWSDFPKNIRLGWRGPDH